MLVLSFDNQWAVYQGSFEEGPVNTGAGSQELCFRHTGNPLEPQCIERLPLFPLG